MITILKFIIKTITLNIVIETTIVGNVIIIEVCDWICKNYTKCIINNMLRFRLNIIIESYKT